MNRQVEQEDRVINLYAANNPLFANYGKKVLQTLIPTGTAALMTTTTWTTTATTKLIRPIKTISVTLPNLKQRLIFPLNRMQDNDNCYCQSSFLDDHPNWKRKSVTSNANDNRLNLIICCQR